MSVARQNISWRLSNWMNAAKLVCDIGKHAVPAFADLGHFPFKQPNLSVVLARTSSINTALQVSDFRTQGFRVLPTPICSWRTPVRSDQCEQTHLPRV